MLPALPRRKPRTEPSIGEPLPAARMPEPPSLVETVSEEEKARPAPDRIVALRLIPRGEELAAERAVTRAAQRRARARPLRDLSPAARHRIAKASVSPASPNRARSTWSTSATPRSRA